MARKLSADDHASISIGLFALAIVALLLSVHYWHVPNLSLLSESHPIWRNIYFWWSSGHSSSDYVFANIFMLIAGSVNNAKGRPPRPWLGVLTLLAGVAAIMAGASLNAEALPQVGIVDSLFVGLVGMTVATFFAEGVPAQVWRNLFARNIDYAGRFFPLAGTLVCLALFAGWVWELDQRWAVRDYVSVVTVASFVVGIMAGLIAGKRRAEPAISAAIA